MIPGGARFRKPQRLESDDVAAALKAGTARRTERFRLSARANALPYARLALVVPKRFAPRAVDRNRVRRLIRETFRLNQFHLAGQDLVVRLTAPIGDEPVSRAEIERLLTGGRRA
ncbi:MAG: ribonuclease P protein component [Burkholderiales bacterium]|nr:ribonuclease P protein component [Burkholderiales bacterium]